MTQTASEFEDFQLRKSDFVVDFVQNGATTQTTNSDAPAAFGQRQENIDNYSRCNYFYTTLLINYCLVLINYRKIADLILLRTN